jgi:hypothetical protein
LKFGVEIRVDIGVAGRPANKDRVVNSYKLFGEVGDIKLNVGDEVLGECEVVEDKVASVLQHCSSLLIFKRSEVRHYSW